MATLKIIDRKDKFLIEVDGSKVPYVTTYELTRKPSGTVLLHLALAMSEVEIEVESDQITTERRTIWLRFTIACMKLLSRSLHG